MEEAEKLWSINLKKLIAELLKSQLKSEPESSR